ncbi:MAG: protein phosphatase 2C domain-containing protein [Saprospiraceae bacterium]|nr:protein phosphatase 2C domain-containing protein [Saprospiraceae bacterium]
MCFSKSGLICSHIGDGRAGYQDNENTWHSVLEPFKGEEANQTIFITSDIWESPNEFIRTTKVNNQIQLVHFNV